MKTMFVRMLGVAVLASLCVIPARANPDTLSLNGSGTVGITSSGSWNLTRCHRGEHISSQTATQLESSAGFNKGLGLLRNQEAKSRSYSCSNKLLQ